MWMPVRQRRPAKETLLKAMCMGDFVNLSRVILYASNMPISSGAIHLLEVACREEPAKRL